MLIENFSFSFSHDNVNLLSILWTVSTLFFDVSDLLLQRYRVMSTNYTGRPIATSFPLIFYWIKQAEHNIPCSRILHPYYACCVLSCTNQ